MLTRTSLALVSLLFVVAGCASTDAGGGPSTPSSASAVGGGRRSLDYFQERTYATFPHADVDWSANGSAVGSFAVEIDWVGSDVTEVEVEYWTRTDEHFTSMPNAMGQRVSGNLPLRFEVPALGPGASGVCHLLLAVREKDVDHAQRHFAEFSGEERRSRRGCEVCYVEFHGGGSQSAPERLPNRVVGQESAPLVSPRFAPQPQIGGAIGFKRFHTAKGERLGIDAETTKIKLYEAEEVHVARSWVWISDEPMSPWQVRQTVTAALVGSTRIVDTREKGVVVGGSDLQFAAPTFRVGLERVHLYIVAQESAPKHPGLFWRYWRIEPIDVSEALPAGTWPYEPLVVELENAHFDRTVSAGVQLSVENHDCP